MRRAAVLAVALLVLAAPAADAAPASLPDLEDEVMCPICGTTLQLSESPQAEREKEFIRGLIDQGKSKQEVKDTLVREYGPDVLATPDDSGFDLAAWIVPVAGFFAAAIGIAIAMRRWRRRSQDEEQAAATPLGEQAERLDDDLARYDL